MCVYGGVMKSLLLKCSLLRCNKDGTKDMNIDKCVLENNSPCYYLIVKENEGVEPEDIWKKFDEFVNKKAKKESPTKESKRLY